MQSTVCNRESISAASLIQIHKLFQARESLHCSGVLPLTLGSGLLDHHALISASPGRDFSSSLNLTLFPKAESQSHKEPVSASLLFISQLVFSECSTHISTSPG